jgi:hypothetical protein
MAGATSGQKLAKSRRQRVLDFRGAGSLVPTQLCYASVPHQADVDSSQSRPTDWSNAGGQEH